REQLNWERDLVGLFLSAHPMSETMVKLKDVVTHTSGKLARAEDEDFVRVAGIVTRVRPHVSKKGDSMAFVGLEDTEGVIDLVVFPRTWKQYGELIEYDKVVIVEGKIDAKQGDPKILVDKVRTEIEITRGRDEIPPVEPEVKDSHPPKVMPEPPPIQKPSVRAAEEPAPYYKNGDMPPPPENFDSGWESMLEEPAPAAVVQHAKTDTELPDLEPSIQKPPEEKSLPAAGLPEPGVQAQPISASEIAPPVLMEIPAVIDKRPMERTPDGRQPQMVTIVLRSMGDKVRDILRMRRIHGMMISYPGHDRFAFYMIEHSRGYRMEFPNDTTEYNEELRARLEDIVGSENIMTEPITFQ
ncbi:MAG: OB-fold nucleic acid binding domain-containing protein, partial [Anaerolineae bacterium]|nr:OB-fold nucleic acid binding domain-containing protein [Anaerolineae bacterium]